jgi:hypothetical protein
LRAVTIALLAGNADRTAGLADPADQFLVDRAREDHFGDLGRGLVSHAQAVDEMRFDAQRLQHPPDLRPPLHDHRVDADGLRAAMSSAKSCASAGSPMAWPPFHHEGTPLH